MTKTEYDQLSTVIATDGLRAVESVLPRVAEAGAASGANPVLLAVLADRRQPEVARERAFARIVTTIRSASTPTPSELHLAA